MSYLSEINELLTECAELIAYNGIVRMTTPEYIRFENKIESFANKYNLTQTDGWRNISQYLLKTSQQYLSNEEVRAVIISLMGFKNVSKPHYSTFDRIFISHSSDDLKYVEPFVKLVEFIGLNKENMFCSSIHGYGIPLSQNIYEYLKSEFNDKNILVIMILSDNYYNSKPCLNEMGATWVMSKDYVAILVGGFEFNQIQGSVDPQKIGFKISDVNRLDEFKDKLLDGLKLPNIHPDEWVKERDNFLKTISAVEEFK